ncbi:MAG TPA: M15 family metallopeptidase [Pseudomonadales bacterium]
MNNDDSPDYVPAELPAELGAMLRSLGIPGNYASTCGMPLQPECSTLVPTEPDVFGRQPQLDALAYAAWTAMKDAAARDGVTLQLVSAFRSIAYQRDLIQRKLARGDSITAILAVNAAPGFSEHHTGRALDIGTPGFTHLEIEFEQSPAFAWLTSHAHDFGFRMSFPRGNPYGVQYEPWHWCYDAGER